MPPPTQTAGLNDWMRHIRRPLGIRWTATHNCVWMPDHRQCIPHALAFVDPLLGHIWKPNRDDGTGPWPFQTWLFWHEISSTKHGPTQKAGRTIVIQGSNLVCDATQQGRFSHQPGVTDRSQDEKQLLDGTRCKTKATRESWDASVARCAPFATCSGEELRSSRER